MFVRSSFESAGTTSTNLRITNTRASVCSFTLLDLLAYFRIEGKPGYSRNIWIIGIYATETIACFARLHFRALKEYMNVPLRTNVNCMFFGSAFSALRYSIHAVLRSTVRGISQPKNVRARGVWCCLIQFPSHSLVNDAVTVLPCLRSYPSLDLLPRKTVSAGWKCRFPSPSAKARDR